MEFCFCESHGRLLSSISTTWPYTRRVLHLCRVCVVMIVSEAYEAEEKNKLPARPAEGTLALVLVMVELFDCCLF